MASPNVISRLKSGMQPGLAESPGTSKRTYPDRTGGTPTKLGAQYLLKPGEEIVASNKHVAAGTIGLLGMPVNNAYNLYLVRATSGHYTLIVFMKIQFLFEDAGKLKWSDADKVNFVTKFSDAIATTWGNRVVKTLSDGRKIMVEFRFDMTIGGWSISEHWEVHVKKIQKGSFSQSFVNPVTGRVTLDSEDVAPVNKLPNSYKGKRFTQRGVVHEFGHMLGLDDEYKVGTPHYADYQSIMNKGEKVYDRHSAEYMRWLDEVLKSKGWK